MRLIVGFVFFSFIDVGTNKFEFIKLSLNNRLFIIALFFNKEIFKLKASQPSLVSQVLTLLTLYVKPLSPIPNHPVYIKTNIVYELYVIECSISISTNDVSKISDIITKDTCIKDGKTEMLIEKVQCKNMEQNVIQKDTFVEEIASQET